jgi:hypothetical protein
MVIYSSFTIFTLILVLFRPTEEEICAVFVRTLDYFAFTYVTQNFPHNENFIVFLMEQFD